MVVLLALGSALAYGLSDYVGGMLSRRSGPWPVVVVSGCTSATIASLLAAVSGGDPSTAALTWGGLAGVGNGVGAVFLYRGLAGGRMSVVAPLSAVGAALLPVVIGLLSGERPAPVTTLGLVCAFPAIWLVSRSSAGSTGGSGLGPGVVDGLIAGLAFGLLFSALGQVPDGSGLWPLTLMQVVTVVSIVVLASGLRQDWLPRHAHDLRAVVIGVLGATAATLFLLATHRGLLSVASVLASLYPAVTVLLAVLLLHERVHRAQGAGLVLALAAVALVAAG